MKPAARHRDFPIGRICLICGRGATDHLGGCFGAAAALLALGYEWNRNETLGYAHNRCLVRMRAKLKAAKT